MLLKFVQDFLKSNSEVCKKIFFNVHSALDFQNFKVFNSFISLIYE